MQSRLVSNSWTPGIFLISWDYKFCYINCGIGRVHFFCMIVVSHVFFLCSFYSFYYSKLWDQPSAECAKALRQACAPISLSILSEIIPFCLQAYSSLSWWFMSLIPALGKLRQEEYLKFKSIQSYLERYFLKNKTKTNKNRPKNQTDTSPQFYRWQLGVVLHTQVPSPCLQPERNAGESGVQGQTGLHGRTLFHKNK